jgi:acyl-CoA synthetase
MCLAVMTRAGTRVSGKEILDHLNAFGLPRYDTPEYFLALDEIPLTTSGRSGGRDRIADSGFQGRRSGPNPS